MRWKPRKPRNKPANRDRRVVDRLIWWPTKLVNPGEGYEWRWLEVSAIQQEYIEGVGWVNEKWTEQTPVERFFDVVSQVCAVIALFCGLVGLVCGLASFGYLWGAG